MENTKRKNALPKEKVTEILRLYKAGKPAGVIARQFGIHPRTVNKLAHRHHVPSQRANLAGNLTKQQRKQLESFYSQGINYREIARIMQLPYRLVRRILNKSKDTDLAFYYRSQSIQRQGPTTTSFLEKLAAFRLRKRYQKDENGNLEKQCYRCQDFWPADTEFFTQQLNVDGLSGLCKACQAEKRELKHAAINNL